MQITLHNKNKNTWKTAVYLAPLRDNYVKIETFVNNCETKVWKNSSNRNFKGRQGSPTGRTILMSPVMVAAAAVCGKVSDAREVFQFDVG